MILAMENAILGAEIVERIARNTKARRGPDYTDEVRRLLTAALEVMSRAGTKGKPRVADIVAAAGLSNDAFYRHFSSKEALVGALLEDGTERLGSYLSHQMAKQGSAEGKVRCWIEGVMSQTDEKIAATTLAVLSNGSSAGNSLAAGRHFASAPLAVLLREPFAELGSTDPEFDATLAAHAVLGKVSDYLWQGTQPSPAELDRITAFCVAAVQNGSSAGGSADADAS
jgi:AcrR family transcriptional regulator